MANKKKLKVKFNFDTYIPELDGSNKGLGSDGKFDSMPMIHDFNALIKMNQIIELDDEIAQRYLTEEHVLPIGSKSEPILPLLSKNAYNKSTNGLYLDDDMVKAKFHGEEVIVNKVDFMKTLNIYDMDEKTYAISHGFMHKYFHVYSSGTLIQRTGLSEFMTPKVLMRAELVA